MTQEDRNNAEKWSKTPGYGPIKYAPWVICEWREANKTTPIDPALFVWNKGFDSPALDCPLTIKLESEDELIDDEGYKWPGIGFVFHGKDYYATVGPDLKVQFTLPCYQDMKTLDYRRASQQTVRLEP